MSATRLEGTRVLLGVTGGIAAYKSPLVLRLLSRAGADVRVAMTEAAEHFVTPTTLEVLSGYPVHTGMFERSDEFAILHIGLAQWADLILIAPVTANTMAKMATGMADSLLSAVTLAATCPIVVAPAMEEHMLASGQVTGNAECLRQLGIHFVDAEEGELASGAHGRGRMASPETILDRVAQVLASSGDEKSTRDLQGMRLLVTAGPTVEDIDPVRFITNRSTGKMGYAIALRAAERGARVRLVTGPTSLPIPPGVEVCVVRSAAEMLDASLVGFDQVDAAILAAAVSDYRPRDVAEEKIKGGSDQLIIDLVPNPDIAAALGERKHQQVLVGFAMETEAGTDRAQEKLERKNLDLIALNNLRQEGAGFAVDTNVVTLIDAHGRTESLPLMPKVAVADHLLDRSRDLWRQRAR